MSAKRVTYVTYNEGLDARKLHLGNLVHNTKTPQSFEPYNETTYTDITEQAPGWARVVPLENYALTLGTASPDDEDEDSGDEDGVRYRVVAAPRSTKLEIKDPQKFFNEITLKSPEAKKWLASHLSAAAALAPNPPPQVWLLTGLILMTHATWTSLSSKQSFVAGLQAPFDPTGVTAIRRSSVSEHVKPVFGIDVPEPSKHISGAVIHETGKYPGTRGWAAQWERVHIQLLPQNKWDKSDNQFVLKNKTGVTSKVAAVKLQSQVYAEQDDDEDDEDEDDEYWESFFDVTEDLA